MKIQDGRFYRSGSGDIVKVRLNSEGWFDKLPFIVEVVIWASIAGEIGVGGPSKYTVDEDGHVWTGKQDRYDLLEEVGEPQPAIHSTPLPNIDADWSEEWGYQA